MTAQMVLPGCEEFIPRPKPILSHGSRRVLEVIEGYSKGAWGCCAAFQRTLARVLRRSVRWLARAIEELKAAGALTVKLRGPYAAEYRLQNQRVAELLAELSRPVLYTESESESHSPEAPRAPSIVAAKPEVHPFDAYFGVFLASGRPLSEHDRMRACQMWISLDGRERPGWQHAAMTDAIDVCRNASHPRFVPLPVNHLIAKPWTRVAMPRTLQPEGKLSRMMREGMEILRRKGMA